MRPPQAPFPGRALDDDEEVQSLRFAHGGLLLWPFVRCAVYFRAREVALAGAAAVAPAPARTAGGRLDRRADLWAHNPLLVGGEFPITVGGTSGGLVADADGRWFDRIHGACVDLFPDQTLCLDASRGGRYRKPRSCRHWRARDFLDHAAWLASRGQRPSAGDSRTLRRFMRVLRDHMGPWLDDAMASLVETRLTALAVALPHLERLWDVYFRRSGTRLLILEDGHYGADAHVLAFAHDRGITTAEMQHGNIDPDHDAYNQGLRLRQSPSWARQMPRHFLSYGQFWRSHIQIPGDTVVLGNPHFSQKQRAVAGLMGQAGGLVFICQAQVAASLVALARDVARVRPDLPITFRLSPGAPAADPLYQPLSHLPGVTISLGDAGDLYPLLARARAVVGSSSTVLFEALGLGKAVFVQDGPDARQYMAAGAGCWFSGAEELVSKLNGSQGSIPSESLFHPDWEQHYRAFVGLHAGVS